jgi:hypothetical protein
MSVRENQDFVDRVRSHRIPSVDAPIAVVHPIYERHFKWRHVRVGDRERYYHEDGPLDAIVTRYAPDWISGYVIIRNSATCVLAQTYDTVEEAKADVLMMMGRIFRHRRA